jgi:hypothetical protein
MLWKFYKACVRGDKMGVFIWGGGVIKIDIFGYGVGAMENSLWLPDIFCRIFLLPTRSSGINPVHLFIGLSISQVCRIREFVAGFIIV